MAKYPLPSADRLRQFLVYDKETGFLTWQTRTVEEFAKNGATAGRVCSIWNARYAGSVAGFATSKGYLKVKFEGLAYQGHRLIWKMVTGNDPDEIDHIDRNKSNNKWENLRDVSHGVNMKNKPLYSNNASGFKNVYWSEKMGKWVVQLSVPGKGQRQIAWKSSLEDAVATRDHFMVLYGYDMELDVA